MRRPRSLLVAFLMTGGGEGVAEMAAIKGGTKLAKVAGEEILELGVRETAEITTREVAEAGARDLAENTAEEVLERGVKEGTEAAADAARVLDDAAGRVPNVFSGLSRARDFRIQPYNRIGTALKGTGLQGHHLI